MRAKTIFLLLITLLLTSAVNARSRYPKREFRGAWIQCVNGQFQGMPAEKMQQLLIRQLNSLQEAGINAIIFQVRAEADALYKSSYEPWSRFLTGVQGRVPSPYWDPMQFMIDECHKRGMEFHAWINPYRAKTKHFVVKIEFFGRNIAKLCGVFISADGNVRVHSLHLIKLEIVEELQLLLVAAQQHFAHQAAVPGSHIRLCAELVAVLDKLADKRPGGSALVID